MNTIKVHKNQQLHQKIEKELRPKMLPSMLFIEQVIPKTLSMTSVNN